MVASFGHHFVGATNEPAVGQQWTRLLEVSLSQLA